MGHVSERRDGGGRDSWENGVSAELYLRALTASRLLACVRALTGGGAVRYPEVLRQMLPGGGSEVAGGGGATAAASGVDPLRRIAQSDTPSLIFELDAAGMDQGEAPARRRELRLVGSTRDRRRAQHDSGGGGVSAVLRLRALTPARLLACVRAVTGSGAVISPELLCQMLPVGGCDGSDGQAGFLNDREVDVLRLLADGESTREIAERMSYSERTVKNIVHGLLVKLECRTRAHAVALASRQGVI